MKLKNLFLLIVLIVLNSVHIYGGNDNSSDKSTPIKINIYGHKLRPKDVGSVGNNVECYYNNGIVYVEFERSEGMATINVTRLDDGLSLSERFNTAVQYQMSIGTSSGSYQIEITTPEDEYIGYLDL